MKARRTGLIASEDVGPYHFGEDVPILLDVARRPWSAHLRERRFRSEWLLDRDTSEARARISTVEERLSRTEERLDEAISRIEALESQRGDITVEAPDPSGTWFITHGEELAQYPNTFIVVDVAMGVIFANADQGKLSEYLLSLPAAYRDSLLVTHTSAHVRA